MTALPGCGGGSRWCWAPSGVGGEERRGWVCPATPRSCLPKECPRISTTHARGGGVWVMPRRNRPLPALFPRVHARPRSRVSPLPTAAKPPPPIGSGRALPAPHRDVSAVRRRRAGRSRRCSAAGPGAGAVGKGGPGRGRRAHARRSCPRVTPNSGGGAAHHPRHAAPLPRVSRPARLCQLAGVGNGGGDPPCTYACVWSPPAACPPRTRPTGGHRGSPSTVPHWGNLRQNSLRRHGLFALPRGDNHLPVAPCHPRVPVPSHHADSLSPLVSQVGVGGPTGHHAAGAGWAQLEEEDRGYSADL